MTGSWKGRGNQYIEFVRVLYCKLKLVQNYVLTFDSAIIYMLHLYEHFDI